MEVTAQQKPKWSVEKIVFLIATICAAVSLILWIVYQPSPVNATTNLAHASLVIILYLTLIFTLVLRTIDTAAERGLAEQTDRAHYLYFGMILGLGIVLRLTLSTVFDGFPNDISAFKAWALAAGQNLPGFYTSGMWSDYPPGYIYVLGILGKIATLTGIDKNAAAFTSLIKLPAMICDILAAYFIYRVASQRKGFETNRRMRLFLMALVVFNPVVFLVSTIWGQVDIILTLIISLALYQLVKKKLFLATVFFAIAILIKPQGIIFLPVLGFELIRDAVARKNAIRILYCALIGFGVFIAGIIPFSFGQENPFWIVLQYLNAMGGYIGASINAFNLFMLLGKNWADDSQILFIFSYLVWGLIFTFCVLAFTAWLYAKDKIRNIPAMPFIAALVLITGLFNLSSRMHERYIFPALLFLLIIYIIQKEKKYLYLFGLMTVVQFINYAYVFICYQNMLIKDYPLSINSPAVYFTSFTSLVVMVCVVLAAISTVVPKNIPIDTPPPAPVKNPGISTKGGNRR